MLPAASSLCGHAVQARVYAEDPKRFCPRPVTLAVFRPPRSPTCASRPVSRGREVTPHYDPLLAKVIRRCERREAIDRLVDALEAFSIEGVKHNIPALLAILRSEEFRAGRVHTGLAAEVVGRRRAGPTTHSLKDIPLASIEVESEVTGSVWKIDASVGQRLEPGDMIMISNP